MTDILEKLENLHKQATTEHSHFYVAECCEAAIAEITRLRSMKEPKLGTITMTYEGGELDGRVVTIGPNGEVS